MTTIREMLEKHAAATKTAAAKPAATAPAAPPQPTMTKEAAEDLLQAAGLPPVKVAQLAGSLQACAKWELNYKEASEFLGYPISVLQAVELAAAGK